MLSFSLSLRTFSPSKHLLPLKSSPSFKPFSFNSIKMSSSSSSSSSPIEHIVLFKVKDGVDSSKINSMLTGLNSLISLDSVLHLTAGPIFRNRSSSFNFTHLLHSRYNSKDDLAQYTAHPNHMSVVKESVLPICDDIMAVDWVADQFQGPVTASAGSAIRVSFLKLKENLGEDVKNKVIEVIRGLKEKLGLDIQLTVGENFSPARAKGFSIASIAIFPGLSELEAVDSNKEMAELEKEKVKDYLENVIVVDYVIPSPPSASL